ncbi:DUF6804 family protein [Mesorhizobium sp.]|jgi:hypothetical protein|uniref:DUF6804 family protein n=1 Tax=Mesorhizobium sp. TaxID=1871066 RepID=UPI00356A65FF
MKLLLNLTADAFLAGDVGNMAHQIFRGRLDTAYNRARLLMVRNVAVIVAIASLLAVGPWPYGYYQLVRVVVFFAGAYCGAMLWRTDQRNLAWGLFAAALVFNPFMPVHLPRELWAVLNVGAAVLFGVVWYCQRG